MASLAGTHFDFADPIKVVEARIAPPGQRGGALLHGAFAGLLPAGPDLATDAGEDHVPDVESHQHLVPRGRARYHLQIAQWRYVASQLSLYQTSLGGVSACSEGWALYAERLMDELGFLEAPGARMGYLDAQLMRAIRVVVDIGMHLELPVAADWAPGGQPWTPELALEFFASHSGRDRDFLESEIVRYLGMPGQAISYKLGERAWRAGRMLQGPRTVAAST